MKKILLIDDDQFMRDVVAAKLTGSEYQVEVATTGEEGLAKIDAELPDLLLLDLDLSDMSGLDILSELKSDSTSQNIPIIIFSNNDAPEIRERTTSAGADAFFVKVSINIDELREQIKETLQS